MQLSEVVGLPRVTPVAVQPLFVYVVMLAGQVMSGRIVSYTLTVCMQVLLLPELSLALHITEVAPKGKVVEG